MAKATSIKFGSFVVKLGDGATPEVFSAPCGFTSKSWTRSKQLTESEIPDCDDPDAPAHVERSVRSLSASISGSGIMAKEALPTWLDFYSSSDSKNCQVSIPNAGVTVTTIEQRYHLSSFEVTGEFGDKVKVSVQLDSDGAFTETTA